MEHTIYLIEKTLTDGSRVYDVRFGDAILSCCTLDDAGNVMNLLRRAIERHTNDTAKNKMLTA